MVERRHIHCGKFTTFNQNFPKETHRCIRTPMKRIEMFNRTVPEVMLNFQQQIGFTGTFTSKAVNTPLEDIRYLLQNVTQVMILKSRFFGNTLIQCFSPSIPQQQTRWKKMRNDECHSQTEHYQDYYPPSLVWDSQ